MLSPAGINQVGITDNHMTVGSGVNIPGAWVISNQDIDAAGHPFTGPPTQACLTPNASSCNASIGRLHLRQVITYQPASRY